MANNAIQLHLLGQMKYTPPLGNRCSSCKHFAPEVLREPHLPPDMPDRCELNPALIVEVHPEGVCGYHERVGEEDE